ncbi:MAG: FHA domain-containing protein [Planctomycetaceae bacterium]|nr:FHA domain-containing protein [Planctomycetaceae bacterium]
MLLSPITGKMRMALVTLRIVDGPERGKFFEQISTPVTIGREEGNSVRLNDERVSRFHAKIHEDNGALLITDLDSTNGTKVNGENTQLWNLRPGDLLTFGRSVMLYGSKEDIARRIQVTQANRNNGGVQMGFIQDDLNEEAVPPPVSAPMDMHATTTGILEELIFQGLDQNDMQILHILLPPPLPSGLNPRQTAELLELLQYIYLRIRYLSGSVESTDNPDRVSLSELQWQNLLDLYDRLAQYMRNITEPA